MKNKHDDLPISASVPDPLSARLSLWAERLHTLGLDSLLSVFLDAAAPLAPLSAQLLYVAQPTLGLVVSRDLLSELARVLEMPGGVDWLRGELCSDLRGADELSADLLADTDDKA